MPVLDNPRHERYAQELAKGQSADAAYQAAGYKAHRGNAATLRANQNILDRVAELQTDMAERTAEKVSITRASVVAELGKLGFVSVPPSEVKASDKRAALLNLAQIEGWLIEKHEHTGKDGGPIETKDVSARETVERRIASLAARGPTEGHTGKPH